MLTDVIQFLLDELANPTLGLVSVFLAGFLAATLLPLGSEPAVFAVVTANPALFWPAMAVATLGNTLGGMTGYWLGYGARTAFARERGTRWFGWLERFGAKTLLLAWLPGVGDPLCTLAGWLKLPFWPCVLYMAIGKFLRYVGVTLALLHVPDGFWRGLAGWLG